MCPHVHGLSPVAPPDDCSLESVTGAVELPQPQMPLHGQTGRWMLLEESEGFPFSVAAGVDSSATGQLYVVFCAHLPILRAGPYCLSSWGSIA